MKNKVYIAGAGTGDIGLVTVKTMEYIKKADVIVYDRLINPDILLNSKENVKLIYVGKENTAGGEIQDRINEILAEEVKKDQSVLRLKGGDPFLYGRGGEEALYLIENGIEFEVIPGISSSLAVPAYAGIPVTHRGLSSELHIFTAHGKDDSEVLEYDKIANLNGTLVFLMGVGRLAHIKEELIKNGKSPECPVAIIENGTRNTQRTISGTLMDICEKAIEADIKAPSIILVGKTVELREKLMYFEKQELFSKRIAVTRDKKQSLEMTEKLNSLGAYTIIEDFIKIEKKDFVMPNLKDYKMILFNSANGVKYFMEKIDDIRVMSRLSIAAVGEITFKELEKYKLKADIKPEKYMVGELIKEAVKVLVENDKVLIVTSDISPIDIKKLNQENKMIFEKVNVYSTLNIKKTDKEMKDFFNRDPKIITFLSSSAVRSFFDNTKYFEKELKNIKFASIGPMTSKTIKEYSYNVEIEADVYTVDGLIEKIKLYYKQGEQDEKI